MKKTLLTLLVAMTGFNALAITCPETIPGTLTKPIPVSFLIDSHVFVLEPTRRASLTVEYDFASAYYSPIGYSHTNSMYAECLYESPYASGSYVTYKNVDYTIQPVINGYKWQKQYEQSSCFSLGDSSQCPFASISKAHR